MLGVIESTRGDQEAAERWVEIAERAASPGDIASQTGIALARGLIATRRGDPSAEMHLERTLELIDDTDMLADRAEYRFQIAEALPDRDRRRAIELVEAGIPLARAKGAVVLERVGEELLARLRSTA